jgi:hypothetical protein
MHSNGFLQAQQQLQCWVLYPRNWQHHACGCMHSNGFLQAQQQLQRWVLFTVSWQHCCMACMWLHVQHRCPASTTAATTLGAAHCIP